MKSKRLIEMALANSGKSKAWLAQKCGISRQLLQYHLDHDTFGDADIDHMLRYINASYYSKKKKIRLYDGVVIDWSNYND